MPFRHLLFNRRNGAPQRAPDQQAISLESARYFSLDNEFPTYAENRWSEDQHYNAQPSPATYNSPMMQDSNFVKGHNTAFNQPFDHSTMFPYNTMNGVPYQNSPYDFDSNSCYPSDVMDTDQSSISQGSLHSSISSASHLDVMFDHDANSLSSLSRKSSVISDTSPAERLCPLLSGQVGRCDPQLCGPDAPCLQYVNDDEIRVPPIEECIPDSNHILSMSGANNQPIDFTTPHNSPRNQRQQRTEGAPNTNLNSLEISQLPTPAEESDKKVRLRTRRSTTKVATSDSKDEPPTTMSKQTKKSRARQAHSLVERKYRENLNAKIQELHQTLQRVQSSRTGSVSSISQFSSHDEDLDPDDDADNDRSSCSSKVKKSDVLIEAMHYVHSAEVELKRKDEEIGRLNDRIKMMETWIRTGGSSGFGGM